MGLTFPHSATGRNKSQVGSALLNTLGPDDGQVAEAQERRLSRLASKRLSASRTRDRMQAACTDLQLKVGVAQRWFRCIAILCTYDVCKTSSEISVNLLYILIVLQRVMSEALLQLWSALSLQPIQACPTWGTIDMFS